IPNFETVSLGIFVNVGSVNENSDQLGISHFVEHMAFKGTKKRTALQISSEIESVGGYINAYTGKEVTAFYVKVLKENVELAIDIVSDIVQNSIFAQSEFEKEKGVIIQEIKQLHDAPDDFVFDMFQAKCFEGEKLGTQILGTEESVNLLTPSDLSSYIKDNYSTDKMIFCASGKVEQDEFLNLSEKYMNKMSSFKTETPINQKYKGGFIFKKKELEQTHLILGFEGLSHTNEDKFSLFALSTILGGGMSSRLFQEAREKRGLVYSIFSFTSNYRDTGVFGTYAACADSKAKEVIDITRNEFAKIIEDLTEEELKKAKTQIKASLLMGLESSSARMERLANQFLLQGRFLTPSDLSKMIDAVSRDSIIALAKKIFSANPTLAVIGAGKDIDKLYDDFN
ncbi:MAG: insulinase family protein, partial [Holosporales bacterium]|nr:insulinase family protein [Holosporales bacterium]